MQVSSPPNNAQPPMPVFEGTGVSDMPIKGFLDDNVMEAGLKPPKIFNSGVMSNSVSQSLSKKADDTIGIYSFKFGERGVAGETEGVANAIKEVVPDKSAFASLGGNKGRNDQGQAM